MGEKQPKKELETNFEGERNLEIVFEEEKEKWRSKMIKIFGDLYPYKFCITYGHSLERPLVEDLPERGRSKREPFERLSDMADIDKKAQEEFDVIISSMEDNKELSYMNEFLEQRKKECVEVFQQFDEVVNLCEKYLNLEYKDCSERMSQQMAVQRPMIQEVERYISEVEEAGDKEIAILKDNIANYLRDMAMNWSSEIEKTYEEMNVQPLIMEVWNESVQAITSKEIRDMFLTQQQTSALMWKKAFQDLLSLSSELERYRHEYTATRSKLERAIYWMNRNYRDNMPELTKTQRRLAAFADRKGALAAELLDLQGRIRQEEGARGRRRKGCGKVEAMQLSNKIAYDKSLAKHQKVFVAKKQEISDLLRYVLKGDQCIYEHLLNKPWNAVDLSFLETDRYSKSKSNIKQEESEESEVNKKENIKTLIEDDFAEAYREFVCDGKFETLLNHIAEELGCILDFKWLDYAKNTLELDHEIRWIELFKVFKVDFVEDCENLKEHMKSFSQQKDGETVFDIQGAIDGFLEFVQQKSCFTSAFETTNSITRTIKQDIHKDFWKAVDDVLPQSALWDSVLDLLEKYRESLQSRRRLLATRSDLVTENEELDRYLENYYNYDVPISPECL